VAAASKIRGHGVFRRATHPLTIVITIALAIKLIILFQLADHPMLSEDSGLDTTAYAELARRIVSGDLLLGPDLYYLSPLYMYVLAAGLAVTDSFTAVRVLQVIAGAVSVGGLWVMTRSWANARAAWWAAGLAVATGVITFYEILILQASIDTALTTAILLALTWALQSGRASWFVVSGAVFGITALNRPNMLAVVVGLAALLLIARRVRPAAALLVGLLIGLAPVAVRNGIVADQWFTVSSHGGLNLYIGNSPTATGFYQTVPGIRPSIAGQAHDAREVAGRALGRVVTDDEASTYFRNQALTWMREHPGDAVVLFAKKFAFVFHASYVALPYSYPFYVHDTDAWLRFLPVGPWLLMPLGLIGLGVLVRRNAGADTLLWLSFVPLYAGAVALFFVADRYRLPLLVPMCAGAGVALDACASAVRARAWKGLVAPGLAGIVLVLLVNTPIALNEGRWEEGLKLAQRYVILGRDDRAAAWVDRLSADAPTQGVAHHLVGRQYLVEGKPALAIPYLTHALDTGLRTPRVSADLATAYERTGRGGDAVGILASISPDRSEPATFWLELGRLASTLKALDIAERMFGHAVTLAQDDGDARLQFGVNLVLQGKLEAAAIQLRSALARNPRQADALAYLAFCELSAGNVEEARRLVEAALAIAPEHPVARSVQAALR
jgi:tetratricopeptide (TPR) repeat protein